jgi:hypothetical protein
VVGGAVDYKTIQESNVDASWRYAWRYGTVCWVGKSLSRPRIRIGGAQVVSFIQVYVRVITMGQLTVNDLQWKLRPMITPRNYSKAVAMTISGQRGPPSKPITL